MFTTASANDGSESVETLILYVLARGTEHKKLGKLGFKPNCDISILFATFTSQVADYHKSRAVLWLRCSWTTLLKTVQMK